MKTYNSIRNLFRALALAMIAMVVLGSCSDDLLEKNPPSEISNSNFWTGESDAMLALVGCYTSSHGWNHDNFDSPQGMLYLDFAGGNGTEKENFTSLMCSTNTLATNSNLRYYWSNAYTNIANCNTFLDNIESCKMSEDKIKAWAAEVKCIRASFLMKLAFHYKDVPMPLTTLNIEEANTIEQTPQQQVYDQCERDLLEAISLLPLEYPSSDYGRYTQGAARALLGRLYLAEERWADAASQYRAIISSGMYEIDRSNGSDSYEKLFWYGGENSKEQLFFINGAKGQYTWSRYIYLTPETYGGWHQFAVYNELVKEYFCSDGLSIEESPLYDKADPYANRDIRLYASVFLPPLGSYPGTEFKGQVYDCYNGGSSSDAYNKFNLFNGYCPKKGLDPSNEDIWSAYVYVPVIRYAEVLLSYLEAVNEYAPNEVDQTLLDLTINDVRDRALLPGLSKSTLSSQQAVRNAVRKERRVELAFEGLRLFDVLRWGIASQELNHTFTGVMLSDDPTAHNYGGNSARDADGYYQFEQRAWASHNRYWPIPQNDLNVNKSLVQNEGYN